MEFPRLTGRQTGKPSCLAETEGAQELGWLMRFDYQALNVVHLRTGANGTHGEYSPDGAGWHMKARIMRIPAAWITIFIL